MFKQTGKTLAWFYRQVRLEKPAYFVYMTLHIICLAAQPFANIVLPKYLLEELMGQRRIGTLAALTAVLVLSNWLLRSLGTVLECRINKLNQWFELYFERKMNIKFMDTDYGHSEDPEILDQGRRAMDGMSWYSGGMYGLTSCFTKMAASAVTLAGVVAIIAVTCPPLFVIAVLAVLATSYVIGRIKKLEVINFNKGPKINRSFHYILDVLCEPRYGKDIRLYHAADMLMKKGGSTLTDLYLTFKELEDGKRIWGCVNAVISMLESIGIYVYLGWQILLRRISVGDFMMLVNAAISLRTNLQEMITQVQELNKKTGFMKEYITFINIRDEMAEGEKEADRTACPEIVFRHVSFRYPGAQTDVLRDVNLTIRPGEHLSVVGLNGAGKTTFIKLLCRFYDVTQGEILVNGINIREYRYEEYMKLLSGVFQDFQLFALSLEDNIRLGCWDREKQDLEELCELCGLGGQVKTLPRGLQTSVYKKFDEEGIEPSGGEAQKIAIARALFKDAPVLVLDEPTAALDPIAEYEIYQHFDRLVGGKTAVYISHRFSSCKFCDRIAVFSDHTIAEYGTHEELIACPDGIYAKMFQAQAQYYV